jgi:hypothetical protein
MSKKKYTAEDFTPDALKMLESKRTVYQCTTCKKVQAHDYIPFSLGHGIWYNPCLCNLVSSSWSHRQAKQIAEYER